MGDGYETLSPLSDLGGSRHGLYCQFADSNGWQARVVASLAAGGGTVACLSPAYETGGVPHGEAMTRDVTGDPNPNPNPNLNPNPNPNPTPTPNPNPKP